MGTGEGKVWLESTVCSLEMRKAICKIETDDFSSFTFLLRRRIGSQTPDPPQRIRCPLVNSLFTKRSLLDWANKALRTRVLNDLQSYAKKQGAIFLKMDPDVVLGTEVPASEDESRRCQWATRDERIEAQRVGVCV